MLEGGLLASFGTEGKTPVMVSEDASYEDGVIREAVVEKFVKYFKAIFHHNTWYFASFVVCEYKYPYVENTNLILIMF